MTIYQSLYTKGSVICSEKINFLSGFVVVSLTFMRNIILFFLLILCSARLSAHNYEFVYSEECKKAYGHFMNLESAEGYAALKKEFISNPQNLMATYIGDYEDCLVLLFNGNPLDYQERKHHLDERLKIIDRYEGESPWYRLCKAGLYMHWAFVEIRFDQKLKAANYFRKSYQLLKENNRLYPSFEYNNLFLGIEIAAVGAIPDNYRWIASIFGMRGDVNKGMGQVEQFIKKHSANEPLYSEAVIYYTYMLYYLKSDKQKSWEYISDYYNANKGLVATFVKANIGLNFHKAADAQAVLQAATTNPYYNTYPIFDYEYGYAYMHSIDDNAISKFRSFLKRYKGNIFVKDAWFRMGQLYHIKGDKGSVSVCRNNTLLKGTDMTDSDKQALRRARGNEWGEPMLIKAQLLLDGGYYQKAYSMLVSEEAEKSLVNKKPIEYYFRLGRVYDELHKKSLAVKYYNKTIDEGRNSTEQFAARAALQLGFLYEREGRSSLAADMYKTALSMHGHDFENSIDQQSKAGLNRLGFNY